MGRPTRESLRHKEAFEFYYGLGQGRSLEQVRLRFGVSDVAVQNWSSQFGWMARVVERDHEVGEKLAAETKTDVARMKERQLKVARAVQSQYIRNLASGKSMVAARDYLLAAKHEAALLGVDMGASEEDVEELLGSILLAIQAEVPDACPACQARLGAKEKLADRFSQLATEWGLQLDPGSIPAVSAEPSPVTPPEASA